MLKKILIVTIVCSSIKLFAPIKDFDILGSLCSGLTKALKDAVTPCRFKNTRKECLSCCHARYGKETAIFKEGALQSKCPGMIEKVCNATCPA